MAFEGAKTQTTAIPRVDAGSCRLCERCAAQRACRTRALIQLDRGEAPYVDAGRCYGCHVCLAACLYGAIRLGY